ncbi:MAG: NnrU family protein [Kiloniellales bacterium]|nr:NnrU family protein [Kiloniellales bacterium]
MAWAEFALAFAVFFASHSFPVRAPVKPWLVARLGATGFTLLYSALSLAVLAWLILAAGRAPFVQIWPWAPWQSQVTVALMLPACLLLAASVARPNPFSFGGGASEKFDPSHPGVVRWTRHPLLAALALWSVAHIVPNGDLAHLLLFGSFAAFAALGGRLVDRRKRREMGETWQDLLVRVEQSPLIAKPASLRATGIRLAAGLGLYFGLFRLHPLILGVEPL